MINAIGIALSGLNNASARLNVGASNIANSLDSGSLHDPAQAPYTPQDVTAQTSGNGGIQTRVIDSLQPFTPSFSPDSPFADEGGFIATPNVNLTEEVVNLKLAEASYRANIAVLEVTDTLFDELLDSFSSSTD